MDIPFNTRCKRCGATSFSLKMDSVTDGYRWRCEGCKAWWRPIHHHGADSYRIKRMKEIAREYSELISSARRDTTKVRLREQALQAIEDVQTVDDFLQKMGVR